MVKWLSARERWQLESAVRLSLFAYMFPKTSRFCSTYPLYHEMSSDPQRKLESPLLEQRKFQHNLTAAHQNEHHSLSFVITLNSATLGKTCFAILCSLSLVDLHMFLYVFVFKAFKIILVLSKLLHIIIIYAMVKQYFSMHIYFIFGGTFILQYYF